MVPNFMEQTALSNLQRLSSKLAEHKDMAKLEGKPNKTNDDQFKYKVVSANRAPCQCLYSYVGITSWKCVQVDSERSAG